MTETIATEVGEAIDGYFAMWNKHDPILRRAIIEETWTPDGSYVEPLMTAQGYDALEAGVSGMQGQFPGHSIRAAGEIETHHDRARWRWELLGPAGGAALAAGTNVAGL